MYVIEYYTCIRFIERTNEADYLKIFSGDGCYSHMGRIGGGQQLSLKKRGCIGEGTVMHEMIHAIGYGKNSSKFSKVTFIMRQQN